MFLFNKLFGQNNTQPKESLQIYQQIPAQSIEAYQRKKAMRYGPPCASNSQSTKISLSKLINNSPLEVINATTQNTKKITYQNVGKVVKKVLKSNYEQICKQFQNSNKLFQDTQFPHSFESLGKTFARANFTWKRISEIIPNAQFITQDIRPEDILQGHLGNCYFLSSLAALAQNEYRIKNIFPKLEINKNGFYMARILHLGVLQQVIVDDFVPVDKDEKPVFSKPSEGSQIWVMILQKCWAKLFGSYEFTIGGQPNQVLYAFSGAPTFHNTITEVKSQQDQLFQTLFRAASEKATMCCGIAELDPKLQQSGLTRMHAYTLLDVFQQPYRMVKLRNPYGCFEWRGKASDTDKQFWNNINPIYKQKLQKNFINDGTFIMMWEDFVCAFAMVDICRINDNSNYFYYQNQYQTDIPVIFQLQTTGGQVVLQLSQPNLRGMEIKQKAKGYGIATIIIAKAITQGSGLKYQYIGSQSDCFFSNFPLVLKDLEPGKYFIYTSYSWTRNKSDLATLSIYSQSGISLSESKVNTTQFLYKTYLNHAIKNKQSMQIIQQKPLQWMTTYILKQNCGFGYMVLHLDKTSTRKVGLQINQKDYNQMKLQLLPPYKGKGNIKLTAKPGDQLIMMFKMLSIKSTSEFILPVIKISFLT